MMNPNVIDPPGFDQKAAWQECRDYVEKCGGLTDENGEPNWRAAFGADPGLCSCPSCGETYWAWGRRQRCDRCGFEYPTDWWPMYSYGVQAAKTGDARHGNKMLMERHERRLDHPYYRYGFEHPVDDAWLEKDRINWRTVFE